MSHVFPLHHINKSKPIKQKLLKLKKPKTFPGTLSREEVKQLIEACNRIRDKFLICLLYETGVRIGEALGLRHEDIQSMGKSDKDFLARKQYPTLGGKIDVRQVPIP